MATLPVEETLQSAVAGGSSYDGPARIQVPADYTLACPPRYSSPPPRPYQGLPSIDYPFHDKVVVVTNCGRICLGRKKINLSTVFAGQAVDCQTCS